MRSYRIPLSALLAAIVMATSPMLAGVKTDTKGMWALQFGLESDARLTSFQGTTLSLQKTTQAGATWRMGLGVSLSTQDRETEQSTEDTSYVVGNEETSSFSIAITVQRLFGLGNRGPIQPYVAFGPLVDYSQSGSESSGPNNPIYKRDYSSWALGARAVLGAEWFVTDYLSLLGEYSLDAVYQSWTDKRTNTYDYGGDTAMNTSETRADGFRIGSGYTHLAVSLYF